MARGRAPAVLAAMTAAALGVACGGAAARPANFSSFESGLGGWQPRGLDLALAGPAGGEAPWSIVPSTDRASDGHASLKVYLGNSPMAVGTGKIFVERTFDLAPGQRYVATISFGFASPAWGDVNLDTVIAGALPASPQSSQDLAPAFQDSTGNGLGADLGYVWLHKRYVVPVQTDATGQVVVVVGCWVREGPRTYYLDGLGIEFAAAP